MRRRKSPFRSYKLIELINSTQQVASKCQFFLLEKQCFAILRSARRWVWLQWREGGREQWAIRPTSNKVQGVRLSGALKTFAKTLAFTMRKRGSHSKVLRSEVLWIDVGITKIILLLHWGKTEGEAKERSTSLRDQLEVCCHKPNEKLYSLGLIWILDRFWNVAVRPDESNPFRLHWL